MNILRKLQRENTLVSISMTYLLDATYLQLLTRSKAMRNNI